MKVTCQNCKAAFYINDDDLPLETTLDKCKSCNAVITIIGKNDSGATDESRSLISVKQPVVNLMPVEQEKTKRCDFCGEEILAVAKKCKHCGEILDVVLRANEEIKRASSSPPPTNLFLSTAHSYTYNYK